MHIQIYTEVHRKLSYTDPDHWSTQPSIFSSDCQRLSVVLGQNFSPVLPQDAGDWIGNPWNNCFNTEQQLSPTYTAGQNSWMPITATKTSQMDVTVSQQWKQLSLLSGRTLGIHSGRTERHAFIGKQGHAQEFCCKPQDLPPLLHTTLQPMFTHLNSFGGGGKSVGSTSS